MFKTVLNVFMTLVCAFMIAVCASFIWLTHSIHEASEGCEINGTVNASCVIEKMNN